MPELLAPCGNIETLNAAIAEGADAVYLGLKNFNARMRTTNFSYNQFQATVDTLHKLGKKIYVTVNTLVIQDELPQLYALLQFLSEVKPDGIIVQDLGVLKIIKDFFPQLRIHASTQMNIASSKAANNISRMGVSRVVLSRELSLQEIHEIKKNTNCELEVFVHGALCISESGNCLFSSFLGGKSANRGMCTQACRRLYTIEDNEKKEQGFYFSPYDLQLLKFIPELVQAGVSSFKIEGRMKSAEYVGTVVSAYRYMLDHWEENRQAAYEHAAKILENDFARKKTSFLFEGVTNLNDTLNPNQDAGTGIFIGSISSVVSGADTKLLEQSIKSLSPKEKTDNKAKDTASIAGSTDPLPNLHFVKINRSSDIVLQAGDSIRLHSKDDELRQSFKLKNIGRLHGEPVFEVPENFGTGDTVYLLQTKAMTKRYRDILPKDFSLFKNKPRMSVNALNDAKRILDRRIAEIEKAEQDEQAKNQLQKNAGYKNKKRPEFADGFYVQVSSLNDLHALLNPRPDAVIVNCNEDTEGFLTDKTKTCPFPRKQLIVSLEPFVGEADVPNLQQQLLLMIESGIRHFVVNNNAHISMLRGHKVSMIAGPYLYAFNRYALEYLHRNGIHSFVSPLENSIDNLEATLSSGKLNLRGDCFITVFNYPALFRIRRPLPTNYNFTHVSDKTGDVYRLLSTPSRSFVLPEKPFAVTEKIAGLQKKGYRKFIMDFSHTAVTKADYKAIYSACLTSTGLADVSKFNWKEGFYDPEKVARLKGDAVR